MTINYQNEKPKEACGVFGIITPPKTPAVYDVHNALFALQHRGQTAAGISSSDGRSLICRKGLGLCEEVFSEECLSELPGHMAVGHVFYASSNADSLVHSQPLVVESRGRKIALAFNGNLTNAEQLKIEIESQGGILHTSGDAELILYNIVRKLAKSNSIESAVVETLPLLRGAFSILILIPEGIIAARDPHGFRPLCIGRRIPSYIDEEFFETVFASESCALDSVEASFVRDVRPGEIVFATSLGGLKSISVQAERPLSLCAFEFVYFARPDSIIDGQSVEMSRQLAGRCLAKQNLVEADVVIGVPDSGLSSALGYAAESGIPYGVGFVKNRYTGRTFIQKTQKNRKRSLKIKLNVIASTVKGKRVVMVDDSIVRGSTTERVVSLLREAGAAEVHMRISSPPYMHPCHFGTDIPNRDQLLASRYTVEEMAKMIGVDSLAFLNLDDFPSIMPNLKIGWCDACFTGEYPIPVCSENLKK